MCKHNDCPYRHCPFHKEYDPELKLDHLDFVIPNNKNEVEDCTSYLDA